MAMLNDQMVTFYNYSYGKSPFLMGHGFAMFNYQTWGTKSESAPWTGNDHLVRWKVLTEPSNHGNRWKSYVSIHEIITFSHKMSIYQRINWYLVPQDMSYRKRPTCHCWMNSLGKTGKILPKMMILKYKSWYGSVSKPCTPGSHQNSWDLWMWITH